MTALTVGNWIGPSPRRPGVRSDGDTGLRRLALFLEKLFGALFDFSGRNVLDVGAEEPAVAGGVFHAAAAVAVELVRRFHDRGGAGFQRLLIGGVRVRH